MLIYLSIQKKVLVFFRVLAHIKLFKFLGMHQIEPENHLQNKQCGQIKVIILYIMKIKLKSCRRRIQENKDV